MINKPLNMDMLLEPQKKHVVKLLNSLYLNGVAFDASSTGTGKSFCGSWIAKQLNCPLVVICPKVVRRTWKKVLDSMGVSVEIYTGKKDEKVNNGAVVINYEKLIRGNTPYLKLVDKNQEGEKFSDYIFNLPKNCLVLLDEVHKCKSFKTKNGELLGALKHFGYKLLLLSATAATNPLEMKSFGYATLLHNFYDFKHFVKEAGAYINNWGGYAIDINSQVTMDAMKKIHNTLFIESGIASRMTTKEFGDIFPSNRVFADEFDMGGNTEKIQHVYDVMEQELAAFDERSKKYSEHHFAIMMKARRLTELLKIPAIVDDIEDLYDEGISPVIFVNFTDSAKAITKILEKNPKFHGKIGYVVGGQTDKVRDQDVDDFQSDVKRIMIVNLAAGGIGIDLHDLNGNYPRHSIVFPGWSAINMLQSLGRIHRAKGLSPCIQRIIYAADTIEVQICRKVQAKLDNLEILNDGDLSFDIQMLKAA